MQDDRTTRLNLPLPFQTNKLSEDVLRLRESFNTLDTNAGVHEDSVVELLRRSLAEAGLTLADGSFEKGATIELATDVVWYRAEGKCYKWDGVEAPDVPAGSTPVGTGGVGTGKWVDVSAASLRAALNEPGGATNIIAGSKSLDDLLDIRISDPRWNIKSSNSPQLNAQNLNALIDIAIQNGRLNIIVDINATIDDITVPVRKKTEVFFIKDGGELNGLYRRAAIPVGAPSNVRTENGVSQPGMAQFYNATSPKVVIMGDSISTDGPNALSNTDSMASLICNKIKEQNRDRAIDFINMAIGGQTWMHANTKPTAFPAWYADTSKNWLDYIQDQSPDLLILAFGMNDANGFNAGALHAVVNKVRAWSKVPSILFVTNPVPAISTTWSSGSGFYATIYQEGRDWAAGYARSYAKFYGDSVLDINRQMCLIRDGRDYSTPPLVSVGTFSQSYLNNSGTTARDFALSGDISSWATGRVLSIKTGPGELDLIFITNSAGNFKFTAFCTGQQNQAYFEITTTVPVTVGQTLNFAVQNNQFTLFSGITKVIAFPVIRTGGEFQPAAQWQDASTTGPFTSVTLSVGNWLQCQYTARDSDIWGHDNGNAETKLPEGGNGINHFSSKGLASVVSPVVESFDFSRKVVEISTYISNMAPGVTTPTAISVKRIGNIISLAGRASSANTGTFKIMDLPASYRPVTQKVISTGSVGAVSWELAILDIRPDGSVNLAFGNMASSLSLDGVTFLV